LFAVGEVTADDALRGVGDPQLDGEGQKGDVLADVFLVTERNIKDFAGIGRCICIDTVLSRNARTPKPNSIP